MKNLQQQLQEQVQLSEAQAREAVKIFRDYLVQNAYDPDLVEDIKLKAKAQYGKLSEKAEQVANDLGDKADAWITKARHQAKQAADKLSDYLDDEKK